MYAINHSITSPNSSPRTAAIGAVCLHDGEGTRASDLFELTRSDVPLNKRKSAHYYVDRAANIYQLVDDGRVAWHAGESHYLGLLNWNTFALGIESEHRRGQDWPLIQLNAIDWLIGTLARRYALSADFLVAHRWIAPTRKSDPTDLADPALAELFARAAPTRLPWKTYRVTTNGSRVRSTPVAAGAIHKTLNAGATFLATPVQGAAVGSKRVWLSLRYGGYMHASLAVEVEEEAPPPMVLRYRRKPTPVYQRQDLTGTIAGYVPAGEVIEIDRTYDNGAGHLVGGLGFVDLSGMDLL